MTTRKRHTLSGGRKPTHADRLLVEGKDVAGRLPELHVSEQTLGLLGNPARSPDTGGVVIMPQHRCWCEGLRTGGKWRSRSVLENLSPSFVQVISDRPRPARFSCRLRRAGAAGWAPGRQAASQSELKGSRRALQLGTHRFAFSQVDQVITILRGPLGR